MLRLSGLIKKAKRRTLPLILASTLAFTPIRAFAETKKEKYAEEVSIDNKFYTVQIEDKSYIVEPSSADVAEKALFAALVKHEIEDGYFNEAFKKESNKLNRLLLKEAIKLTGKCVQEAITDPIKKLKDPAGLLGSFRGITGPKSFINSLKGFFSTWWTNLPSTLERRAVDPKLYAYRAIGQASRSFDEKLAEAKELLKDGFTYEEAKEAYSYLKEIKASMPHLIQLVKDIDNSADPRFKVDERELEGFQSLKWEGYGENRHIAAEDEQKLEELRERIGLRVGSSEEYKRYEKAVESAKSKTLEEIAASYEYDTIRKVAKKPPEEARSKFGTDYKKVRKYLKKIGKGKIANLKLIREDINRDSIEDIVGCAEVITNEERNEHGYVLKYFEGLVFVLTKKKGLECSTIDDWEELIGSGKFKLKELVVYDFDKDGKKDILVVKEYGYRRVGSKTFYILNYGEDGPKLILKASIDFDWLKGFDDEYLKKLDGYGDVLSKKIGESSERGDYDSLYKFLLYKQVADKLRENLRRLSDD